jgi:hypothetical protein
MVRRYTIEDIHFLAEERGGKCLSNKYSTFPLTWECAKGYIWDAKSCNIVHGTWCPICHGKKKITIEYIKEFAAHKGGDCISDIYINSTTKLSWKCSKGHTWDAKPANILYNNRWCPTCGREKLTEKNTKYSISDMQVIAKDRGGFCLSEKYINDTTKLKWQCKNGHIWDAKPNKIKHGQWCPFCAGFNQTIEKYKKIAIERGGSMLSDTFSGTTKKYQWICAKGHSWEATALNIKKGTWCPECMKEKIGDAQRKYSIKEMRSFAKEKGGECLSKEFKNSQELLEWQCSFGHIWKASFGNINSGNTWCPFCAGRNKTIEDMRTIAEERGGKCLSSDFQGVKSPIHWECAFGHKWIAVPESIIDGRWCPECSKGYSERIVRSYFEQMFGKKFTTKRPVWLVNSDGYRMELDGYNEVLQLAFEHQGLQHKVEHSFFHSTEHAFTKRLQDDNTKRKLCEDHSVNLIEVPQLFRDIELEDLFDYIIQETEPLGYSVAIKKESIKLDFKQIYKPALANEVEEIVKKRGGEIISPILENRKLRFRLRCVNGHEWEAVLGSIKSGSWCPYCAGHVKKTIDDMHQLALNMKGRCLSKVYTNIETKLTWECENGHI